MTILHQKSNHKCKTQKPDWCSSTATESQIYQYIIQQNKLEFHSWGESIQVIISDQIINPFKIVIVNQVHLYYINVNYLVMTGKIAFKSRFLTKHAALKAKLKNKSDACSLTQIQQYNATNSWEMIFRWQL